MYHSETYGNLLGSYLGGAHKEIDRSKGHTYMSAVVDLILLLLLAGASHEDIPEDAFETHYNPETGTPTTPQGEAYDAAVQAAQDALDKVWAVLPQLEAAQDAQDALGAAYKNLTA